MRYDPARTQDPLSPAATAPRTPQWPSLVGAPTDTYATWPGTTSTDQGSPAVLIVARVSKCTCPETGELFVVVSEVLEAL